MTQDDGGRVSMSTDIKEPDYCYSCNGDLYSDDLSEECEKCESCDDYCATRVTIMRAERQDLSARDLITFDLHDRMSEVASEMLGEAAEFIELGDSEALQESFLRWIDSECPDINTYRAINAHEIVCEWISSGIDSEGGVNEGWDIVEVIKP